MGLALTISNILASLSNVRLMLLALAVNFVVVPALGHGAAELLISDENRADPGGCGGWRAVPAQGSPRPLADRWRSAVGLMVALMLVTIVYLPLVLPLLLPGMTSRSIPGRSRSR